MSNIPVQRNEELSSEWIVRLAFWDPEKIIFLDESAANERTGDRKYGWSPRGYPCRVKNSCKRSKRWSILPAISMNGCIAWDIYQGSYNTERFNEFVRLRVLPVCPPGTVLVVDNCNIHRSQELKNLCVEAGIELAFLPPYSPDFNPIEQSFHALKAWIRKNQALAREYGDNFEAFLHLAVGSFMEGKNARGYYRSSCIG